MRRGIWSPPPPQPIAGPPEMPTFHEFASEWFEGLHHEGLAPTTLADYEWQLTKHRLPFFASHNMSAITIAEVDRYRQAKVREGALSATSINTTIGRLAQILEVAVERDLIARNPARGKRRRLKQRKPTRTTLDRAEQIEALLAGARELDREARVDRQATPRGTLLALLVFSGARIGEALALRWRDVDLAGGRMGIRASKTDSGVRTGLRRSLHRGRDQEKSGACGPVHHLGPRSGARASRRAYGCGDARWTAPCHARARGSAWAKDRAGDRRSRWTDRGRIAILVTQACQIPHNVIKTIYEWLRAIARCQQPCQPLASSRGGGS